MSWDKIAKKYSGVNLLNEDKHALKYRKKILDLSKKYFSIAHKKKKFKPGETFIAASSKYLTEDDLVNLIDSSLDLWLTAGRYADLFEKELAKKFGSRLASTTVSGSSANLLAFSALTSEKLSNPIRDGDEVITVAAGFPTTVAPIIHNRCIPVYLDVELSTGNVNTKNLKKALSKKTKAVFLAHTLGNPFNLKKVKKFCEDHDLYLIEDCCDAFGSKYNGKKVGNFGNFATLSFYPAHHITTGEGGAVLYNDFKYKKIVESLRDWGRDCWCKTGMNNTCGKRFSWKLGELPMGYDHKFIYSHVGYNMRMTDMQAALGLSQLNKIDFFIKKRNNNFYYLDTKFKENGLDKYFYLPKSYKDSEPSWYGYLITLRDGKKFNRNEMIKYLNSKKILTRLLFAGNLTKQPGYMNKQHRVVGKLNITNKLMRDAFWLGVWPGLEKEQLDYVVSEIKNFIAEK